jgi:hypothetical protein
MDNDIRLKLHIVKPSEEPNLCLNIFCFIANLLLSFTPIIYLTFPCSVICFFSKRSQRSRQAALSALCGAFLAFVLAALWLFMSLTSSYHYLKNPPTQDKVMSIDTD